MGWIEGMKEDVKWENSFQQCMKVTTFTAVNIVHDFFYKKKKNLIGKP